MTDDSYSDRLRARLDAMAPASAPKVTLVEYVKKDGVAATIWAARDDGLTWPQITDGVNDDLGADYAPTTVATTMSRCAPRRQVAARRSGSPPKRPIAFREPVHTRQVVRRPSRALTNTTADENSSDTLSHHSPSAGEEPSSPAEPDLQRDSASSASSERTSSGPRVVRRIK